MNADKVLLTFHAADMPATQAFAARLAPGCTAGDCLALHGDLGAGKTSFARGFIQALTSGQEEIISPTFTLVQIYSARDGTLLSHVDLYRLQHVEELQEIGLEDALTQGITLIEWPELAQSLLPDTTLAITLAPGESVGSRHITLRGRPDYWAKRLAVLGEPA